LALQMADLVREDRAHLVHRQRAEQGHAEHQDVAIRTERAEPRLREEAGGRSRVQNDCVHPWRAEPMA